MREVQQKAKQPTGYDRLCVGKTREERAALPGFSETPVVRMLIPDDAPLVFDDVIRGKVSAPRPDDQVILKADGFPTYHLAVVVDDHLMGSRTSCAARSGSAPRPSTSCSTTGSASSRRRSRTCRCCATPTSPRSPSARTPPPGSPGSASRATCPRRCVNFLALLAYPPQQDAEGADVEVFTFDDFSRTFDWAKVNPIGPIFDLKKLDWLNGVYIRSLDVGEFAGRLLPYLIADGVLGETQSLGELARLKAVAELIQTRMVLLTEAPALVRRSSSATTSSSSTRMLAPSRDDAGQVLDAGAASARRRRRPRHRAARHRQRLERRDHRGSAARGHRRGARHQAAVRLRSAADRGSGARVSPPLFESMEILGKTSTLARLRSLRDSL